MPGTSKLTFKVVGLKGGESTRLAEMILYVCGVCEEDSSFGMTRLNKILFEADFLSFQTRGVPITGARYQRLQNGPAPKAMLPLLRELQANGSLKIRETDYLGKPQHRPVALRRPELKYFGPEDIAFVERCIRESWGKSAGKVSVQSHRIEWKTRPNGADIPYEASWLSDAKVSEAEVERTKELAAEFGW